MDRQEQASQSFHEDPEKNVAAPDAPRVSLFSTCRTDLHASVLEFVGTTFFLTLGFGGIQAATSARSSVDTDNLETVMFTSTCMGFSLLVTVWLFFRVTGGLFNPNVSLALFLVGAIRPVRFALYCVAQLAGGIAASAIILAITPGSLAVNTVLAHGVNPLMGVFIEDIITGALVLSVLMLAAEKTHATPNAPVGIGLTLFACHLFAVWFTGASMNTARSFGPAVVTGFSTPYHWVYWVGPCFGTLVSSGFYVGLKHYRSWMLNAEPTASDEEKAPLAKSIVTQDGAFMPDSTSVVVPKGTLAPNQPTMLVPVAHTMSAMGGNPVMSSRGNEVLGTSVPAGTQLEVTGAPIVLSNTMGTQSALGVDLDAIGMQQALSMMEMGRAESRASTLNNGREKTQKNDVGPKEYMGLGDLVN